MDILSIAGMSIEIKRLEPDMIVCVYSVYFVTKITTTNHLVKHVVSYLPLFLGWGDCSVG